MIVIGLTRSNEEEEEARAVGLKLDVYRLASYVRDRRDGGGGARKLKPAGNDFQLCSFTVSKNKSNFPTVY